jgi:hypothetical protein
MSKESDDRKELERRLDQVRRLSSVAHDDLTKERLNGLVHDLEEQLKKPE